MQKKVEGPGGKSPSCESDLWLNDQNGEECMSQHPFRSAAREKSLDARPAEAPHNNYIRLIFLCSIGNDFVYHTVQLIYIRKLSYS